MKGYSSWGKKNSNTLTNAHSHGSIENGQSIDQEDMVQRDDISHAQTHQNKYYGDPLVPQNYQTNSLIL